MAMRKQKSELIALYDAECSQSTTQEDAKRKKKMDEDIPQPEEWAAFFPLLANQFEEDEPYHRKIYRWALGWTWTMKKDRLLHLREVFFARMGFRTWVDRATCDLIMAQDPNHWVWKRDRNVHHSWAVRWFRRDTALSCSLCKGPVTHNDLPAIPKTMRPDRDRRTSLFSLIEYLNMDQYEGKSSAR
ncbi:speedy protein 1-A-like [Anomaloglossus baeobatrachus]|uniref:speedy protein 1-A-like n=1 Tax=Anomaloglossus baeobatrachus TaxID=238106 RepID=UPI003F50B499